MSRLAGPGKCWACPYHKPPPRPAAYLWTAQPSGNKIRLCVECCAAWRELARKDPGLAPARIQSLH